MKKTEELVIVNSIGQICRLSTSKDLQAGENIAVELVMVYLPKKKQIVLFNRGSGASDMHDHWALEAGKLNAKDLLDEKLGDKVSLEAFKKAASREFNEELNFSISPEEFDYADEFHMADKKIFFTLLSLPIEEHQIEKLAPDQSEVDKLRCFTLDEFDVNPDLGDAIMFRKGNIIEYLREKFSS